MRKLNRYVALAVLAAALVPAGCRKAETPPPQDVILTGADALPEDPADPAWEAAPEYVAALLLQDVVDPRLFEKSTGEVRVRALSDGSDVAFRLEWADASADDLPGPDRFSDACAIQLPAEIRPTVPDPQMGGHDQPVRITYWRASWQAALDGRGDTLQDLYPNATVDHYPFEAASLEPGSPEQEAMADRYAPARALGNRMAGPRDSAVEDLVAEGPGTIAPAESSESTGRGERTDDGWAVVLRRPVPKGLDAQGHSQVAFAVWEGSRGEAGARKMRTGWITLTSGEQP